MTATEAKAAITRYGSQTKAAAALGCGRKTIRKALAKCGGATDAKPHVAPAAGRSLSEFRATYDKSTIVPAKVKAGLSALGNRWEYEVVFAKMVGVSLMDLGAVREQFAEYVVSMRERRAWAGTKATAEAMRRML